MSRVKRQHGYPALVGYEQTCSQTHQSCFAGPVWTDQAGDYPSRHLHTDVVQCFNLPFPSSESFADVLEFQSDLIGLAIFWSYFVGIRVQCYLQPVDSM